MGSVLREFVIDCIDARRIAEFWGAALGWQVQHEEDFFWMSASGEESATDLVLVCAPVPERKTVKNRVHIDLSPRGCDQAEELARLQDLGATTVDVGQGEQPWIVLADPEGNEFCLLRRRID